MEGCKKRMETPLAGERLRPLGHLSVAALIRAKSLLIKPFFNVPAENDRNNLCRLRRLKPERLTNTLAQTARQRHIDVLQAFPIGL